jgi:hypothetical protein
MGKQRTSRPQAYKAPNLGTKKTKEMEKQDVDARVSSDSVFAEGELEKLVGQFVNANATLGTSRIVPVTTPSLRVRNWP